MAVASGVTTQGEALTICHRMYGHRWDYAYAQGVKEYACQRCQIRLLVSKRKEVTVVAYG